MAYKLNKKIEKTNDYLLNAMRNGVQFEDNTEISEPTMETSNASLGNQNIGVGYNAGLTGVSGASGVSGVVGYREIYYNAPSYYGGVDPVIANPANEILLGKETPETTVITNKSDYEKYLEAQEKNRHFINQTNKYETVSSDKYTQTGKMSFGESKPKKPLTYQEIVESWKKEKPKKNKKEEEKIIIDKDEELVVNIEELADELADEAIKSKENTLKYEELLNYYKKLILKHERRKKE